MIYGIFAAAAFDDAVASLCPRKIGSHINTTIVSVTSMVCMLRDHRKRRKRLGAIGVFSHNRSDRLE